MLATHTNRALLTTPLPDGRAVAQAFFIKRGIVCTTDSLWTAGQRRAHSLHELSYRACFKPQLPEYFIERYTRAGDVVLDPFMGRGTTPIQAMLMGRVAAGSDINPISVLMARPRIHPPSIDDMCARLQQIPLSLSLIHI